MPTTQKTALVISGGTARGAYAAGLVCELFSRPELADGIQIISGTSTGSLIAPMLGLYCVTKDPELLKLIEGQYQVGSTAVFRDEPKKCSWKAIGWGARRLGADDEQSRMLAMLGETGAVLDTTPLRGIIDAQFTDDRLQQLFAARERPLEVLVNCVSAQSGGVVSFSSAAPDMTCARFRDAIYASCLQPILMPLQPIGTEELMDGGVRDVVPAYGAWKAGATRMLLVTLFHASDGTTPAAGPFAGREHLLDLLQRVVLGLLDQEVQDDDLLQARYLATIGKLVRFARGTGADDAKIASLLKDLVEEERAHYLGEHFFDEIHIHRPLESAPLEDKFRWGPTDMQQSINAGRAAAKSEEGTKMAEFLMSGQAAAAPALPKAAGAQG